jgi:large subunit ribosomal protein L35
LYCSTVPERDETVLMPKMKSNSGAKKRFKVTGTGKIMRKKAYTSHILTKKSQKRKRNLRKQTVVDKADEPRIRQLIKT